MNIVDSECLVCGSSLRWLSGTPRLCVECVEPKSDPPQKQSAIVKTDKQLAELGQQLQLF